MFYIWVQNVWFQIFIWKLHGVEKMTYIYLEIVICSYQLNSKNKWQIIIFLYSFFLSISCLITIWQNTWYFPHWWQLEASLMETKQIRKKVGKFLWIISIRNLFTFLNLLFGLLSSGQFNYTFWAQMSSEWMFAGVKMGSAFISWIMIGI